MVFRLKYRLDDVLTWLIGKVLMKRDTSRGFLCSETRKALLSADDGCSREYRKAFLIMKGGVGRNLRQGHRLRRLNHLKKERANLAA